MKCYIKDYPRPQFVRSSWENLNGAWRFRFDDQKIGKKENWFDGLKENQEILHMRQRQVESRTKKSIRASGMNVMYLCGKWKQKSCCFILKVAIMRQKYG